MGYITTLSSKFQISIPKEVRIAQGWEAGQKFVFIPTPAGKYELVAVPKISDVAGSMKGASAENYRDRRDRFNAAL
jgi:AbrB family looped-hinge helix DNA binding protein